MNKNITVPGKGGISATIIADSIHDEGNIPITTYEFEYPRFIHAELMTHRMFSRNAASSRAIPVERMIELIQARVAMPIHWGLNQAGMQANAECTENVVIRPTSNKIIRWIFSKIPGLNVTREVAWKAAASTAIFFAKAFHAAGFHKQIVNRMLEPFSFMKVVVTATEFDNFFYLRNHKDAQPEIHELARVALLAFMTRSTNELKTGWWHTPYFGNGYWAPFHANEDTTDLDRPYTLDEALKISSSCCAQVSYRRLNDTLEKAYEVYDRLVTSRPLHASPFEHQGTPIIGFGQEGVTHVRFDSINLDAPLSEATPNALWSGNLRGWVQYRQLMKDHTCWDYNPY